MDSVISPRPRPITPNNLIDSIPLWLCSFSNTCCSMGSVEFSTTTICAGISEIDIVTLAEGGGGEADPGGPTIPLF